MLLKPDETAKLLGRSLTSAETENFELYLNIATQRLEKLLCMNLSSDDGERTYESRTGYRTLYVDPFTDITSVTIDDDEVDSADYTIKQNDNLNASWYNIIEFDRARSGQKVVVDASWGFSPCPYDLKMLLARLFAQGTVEHSVDNQVKSKKIEDFSVTFKDSATYDEFVDANKAIISKYSYCNQGYIRHGRVRSVRYY